MLTFGRILRFRRVRGSATQSTWLHSLRPRNLASRRLQAREAGRAAQLAVSVRPLRVKSRHPTSANSRRDLPELLSRSHFSIRRDWPFDWRRRRLRQNSGRSHLRLDRAVRRGQDDALRLYLAPLRSRRRIDGVRRPPARELGQTRARLPRHRPGLFQAAGPDLTSVVGRPDCGLRSPSLSTCRMSAVARSTAAAILARSAFVGVSTSGPSSTFGRRPLAGRPRN